MISWMRRPTVIDRRMELLMGLMEPRTVAWLVRELGVKSQGIHKLVRELVDLKDVRACGMTKEHHLGAPARQYVVTAKGKQKLQRLAKRLRKQAEEIEGVLG